MSDDRPFLATSVGSFHFISFSDEVLSFGKSASQILIYLFLFSQGSLRDERSFYTASSSSVRQSTTLSLHMLQVSRLDEEDGFESRFDETEDVLYYD
jgi:hypothetical protein